MSAPIAAGRRGKGGRMATVKLALVALFVFVATFMWLPPALHAEVTAAIILLALIVPTAHRWFTHRVR